jgi:cytochrome c
MKQYVIAAGLSLFAALALAQTPANDKAAIDKAVTAKVIGDADRGRLVFGTCRTCHLPTKGAGNHNGPNLYGIFGRKAGTREGFLYYSDEMKSAGFEWTPELLDLWLANPSGFLPNSTMIFVGIDDPQRRADLIEYLKTFHD